MSNYYAVEITRKRNVIENDSFSLVFVIYDENHDIVTDLSGFKFSFKLDNGALEVLKYDTNYDDGSSSQISVSGEKVTVNIEEDDTDNFRDNWWDSILQMVNKSTGDRYTVFRKLLGFTSEMFDEV